MLSIVRQWKPSKCGRCARPPGACRKEECRMGSLFRPHPGLLPHEKVVRAATAECEMGETMKNEPVRTRGMAGRYRSIKMIRSHPTKSNQIRPKKNGPARIK